MQDSNKVANATGQKKFNPKPGDKIICNNGKEFICCTLEELKSKGCGSSLKGEVGAVFGISGNWEKDFSWMYWQEDNYPGRPDWEIREVLSFEPKEIAKEEGLRYTVEEVTEAFANALHLSWLGGRQEGVNKVKDYLSKKHNTEYQEYLRLKAIYE